MRNRASPPPRPHDASHHLVAAFTATLLAVVAGHTAARSIPALF